MIWLPTLALGGCTTVAEVDLSTPAQESPSTEEVRPGGALSLGGDGHQGVKEERFPACGPGYTRLDGTPPLPIAAVGIALPLTGAAEGRAGPELSTLSGCPTE